MQPGKPILDDSLKEEITGFARACGIRKVILFGSRARGDCREKSDVDLAVSGGNIADFRFFVDEKTRTLLSFDIVNPDLGISPELARDIRRDGVVICEEA